MKVPLFCAGVLAALSMAAPAVTLTLTNADFQATGQDTNPSGWTTTESAGGNVYVYASGGGIPASTNVLAFHARPGSSVQQSFLTSEVTADSYGLFEISFDSGWRNNTGAPNDLSLVVSIFSVTDDSVLGSASYTFPANTPSNAFDSYRVIGSQSLQISYDNSLASLAGDTIAIRFATSTSQNNFNPTGWIDNVSVSAIPELTSMPVLGSILLLGLLGHRRR